MHISLLFTCWLLLSIFLISCDLQNETPTTGDTKTEPKFTGTIITVGDSLTAGLGVSEEEAWPALLEKRLKKNGYHWQVLNAGISGETSSGTLSRIKWITAQKPDIVILETGANDGLRGVPPQVIKENISSTVQILNEGNVTVVLAGMRIVQNLGQEYTADFAGIYPAVAGEKDVILVPFFLQGVAGEPSLNQADTIHPNKHGHKIILDTMYPYVLKAVQASS